MPVNNNNIHNSSDVIINSNHHHHRQHHHHHHILIGRLSLMIQSADNLNKYNEYIYFAFARNISTHYNLTGRRQSYYLFIYWRLIAQSTSRHFTKSNLTEVKYNTKHAYFTKIKHINIIRKLVPSVLLSLKKRRANKVRRCWYHWPFGLAFQYQILKVKKKNGQKQSQIKITI